MTLKILVVATRKGFASRASSIGQSHQRGIYGKKIVQYGGQYSTRRTIFLNYKSQ